MRPRWYGDNRDLVKWGVLLHLAQDHGAGRILQVAFLRPNDWPHLEIDGEQRPIPESVTNHFRNVRAVEGLSRDIRIEVIDSVFEERRSYLAVVVKAVAARREGERCVVFLDPDTRVLSRANRAWSMCLGRRS